MTALTILLSNHTSFAEPIYRHVDATGKVTYSTEPNTAGEQPAALPQIKRVRIDTPPTTVTPQFQTCEKRGGIECSKGADADGSVLCRDGSKDSLERFGEFCVEVRLSAGKAEFTDREGKSFVPKTISDMEKLGEVRVTVRNLQGIVAKGVHAEVLFPRPFGSLELHGPAQVDAYGLAEYSADLSGVRSMYLQKFLQLKPAVRCENCRAVLGSR